ncbi:hypothetical protein [Xanthomonas sp. WHRI 7945]|nr:hypothetical protein [Xanthomonas campestris pv. campestris]
MNRVENEGAAALYAFARQLEAEAAAYRRVLQRGAERSTTVEALLQAASMARQTAYQVERKGLDAAMRQVPRLPEGEVLDRAVEAARVEWFRSVHGRDPASREFNHLQGCAMRNAVVAAWPHLRAAAPKPETEA